MLWAFMITTPLNSIGIIVLAAGESRRLGVPKQLAMWNGESLLHKAAREATLVPDTEVVVVMGAQAHEFRREIVHLPAQISVNADWQSGMSSSLRTGLQCLLASNPDIQACIFMVCDQPHVSVQLLQSMITIYRVSGRRIVAAEYNGILGVPALFDQSLFR